MPITWRLSRDHHGPPFASDTNWVAIIGSTVIGGVSREVFSDHRGRFNWYVDVEISSEGRGHLDTVEEAKSAVERVWWAWVARNWLRDDPEVEPAPGRRETNAPTEPAAPRGGTIILAR
jgi:hypothetical protein